MDIKAKTSDGKIMIKKIFRNLLFGLFLSGIITQIADAQTTINDPFGDHSTTAGNSVVDVGNVTVSSDGVNVNITINFSSDTVLSDLAGIIDLDTDQNASTGLLSIVGSSNQNIGTDYFLDLFGIPVGLSIDVYDTDYNVVGTASVTSSGGSAIISVPLSTLGNDDGNMDVGLMLGNTQEPTDDAANPTVPLSLNQQSFRSGDILTLTVSIYPGASATSVDAYIALRLPNGSLLFLLLGANFTGSMNPIVSSFTPVSYNGTIFQHTFTGAEPSGTYTWLSAFTDPGTLNFIGNIEQTQFTFSP